MQIKTETKNGIIVCYIDGEINLSTSPELKKSIEKIISAKSAKLLLR